LKEILIDDVRCRIFPSGSPSFILLQPTARHEIPTLESEAEKIAAATDLPFVLAVFEVRDWTLDLMPWPDRNISREEKAGKRAKATLDFVLKSLLPALEEMFGAGLPVILGGYSLGGLFALWASALSDRFSAVAAASPSLWIRDWLPFVRKHPPSASCLYLSLGDREEHVKNQAIARVGECVRETYRLLSDTKHCTLVWEEGNHFTDNDGRLARAFAWCMEQF
jgi:predicted alpha/beta superfamily hydrolase